MRTDMRNNRRNPRQKVNAQAWIETGNDARRQRCQVVDISQNGARLIVEDVEGTPDSFKLLLSRFGHPCHRCCVVWKRDNEVGVEFLAAPASERRAVAGAAAP